jgi:hypothetical protein
VSSPVDFVSGTMGIVSVTMDFVSALTESSLRQWILFLRRWVSCPVPLTEKEEFIDRILTENKNRFLLIVRHFAPADEAMDLYQEIDGLLAASINKGVSNVSQADFGRVRGNFLICRSWPLGDCPSTQRQTVLPSLFPLFENIRAAAIIISPSPDCAKLSEIEGSMKTTALLGSLFRS